MGKVKPPWTKGYIKQCPQYGHYGNSRGAADEAVKSITCDLVTEFANWQMIEEKLKGSGYFADPYCAWQKGTNENLNGLLRQFYPTGRNLSGVSPATQKKNLALINARPKKVLGFKKTY